MPVVFALSQNKNKPSGSGFAAGDLRAHRCLTQHSSVVSCSYVSTILLFSLKETNGAFLSLVQFRSDVTEQNENLICNL